MDAPLTTPAGSGGVTVRPATPADVPLVVAMVRELAEYEKLLHAAEATEEHFRDALFGAQPRVFCDLAIWNGDVGGLAVWFYNFSTFTGRCGIYLEDLYVRPPMRSHGLGKALLRHLARRCLDERLTRLDWSVLDWNTPAIDFYRGQGAELLEDWTACRLSGEALANVAASP